MALSASLTLAIAACGEIEGVDYLTLGHPADPAAQAGKHEAMSRSLEPEIITVKPDLKPAASAKPGRMAQPQKAMDHSMHGGGN